MDIHDSDIDAWRRVHRQLTLALIQSRDNIAAELTQRRYLLEEMNRCKALNNNMLQKSPTPGNTSSSSTKPKKAAPVSKKEKAKVAAPAPAPKPKKSKPPTTPTATVGDYIKVAEKMSPAMKDLSKIVAPKAKPSKVKAKQAKKDLKTKESDAVVGTAPATPAAAATTTTTTTPSSRSLPPSNMNTGTAMTASSSSQSYNEQLSNTMNVSADVINGGELLMSNLRFAGMAAASAAAQPMGQVFYPPGAAAAAGAQYGLYGDMSTLGRTGLGIATPEQMGLAFHLIQHMNQNTNNNAANNDGEGNNI